MKTPEGREKDRVRAYLKKIGAYQFWPVQTGYGMTTVDCLACINGEFWAIEVKAENKKATFRQNAVLNAVVSARGTAICGTSRNIIDVLSRHQG